jgi:hypothetical protein
MKSSRKPIPSAVAHQVRDQCDSACANPSCRQWNTSTHELHHIDGDSSNSTAENLILLCANCHSKEQSGIITREEILIWKSRAKLGNLPLPKEIIPPQTRVETNNGMIVGRVEKLKVTLSGGSKKADFVFPGTIGANLDMREYANRLVKRYIEWRMKSDQYWPSAKRQPFKAGAAHGILCKGYGSQSVLKIPAHRFFEWVNSAQQKIDGTIFGKQQTKNYSTWEEFLEERHGGK